MLNDFRYALRTLRQNPGFALTAIVSIALGIGANATIFSFGDGLLFRPLPVPNASQVLTLRTRMPSGDFGDLSYRDYVDFRDKTRSFEGLTAARLEPIGFAKDSHTQSQVKYGFLVSGNFFRVLGVEPRLGRGFKPEEDQAPGRDAVMVLAHSFWKTEFSSDPSVVGRSVRLNGLEFKIVGVAPESFTGPNLFVRPAFYVPVMMGPALLASQEDLLTNRSLRSLVVKGRLRTGVSIPAAEAEAAAFAKSLAQSYPASNRGFGAAVRTETQNRNDDIPADRALIVLLFGLVIVALAIACANVANLMLSRGHARTREIAVRLAIGASRGRLVRQLMAESLLIALAGGAVGLLIAQFGVAELSLIQIPGDIPIQLSFELDARVLWFTLLISVVTALLFGLVPALQSTKTDLVPALKAGLSEQGRRRWFGRGALVTVQVAGALVLLVAATQLYRGFRYVLDHSPGFRVDQMITMSFNPTLAHYTPAQTEQFYKTLIERTSAAPGIRSAALASFPPLGINIQPRQVIPEGYRFPPGQESVGILSNVVDPHYFDTFGVALTRGRGFLSTDRADAPPVAVINEAFAEHYYPGQSPLGKRFQQNGSWVEIVGVTATTKYLQIFEGPTDFLYLPLGQNPQPQMTLLAQTSGDPAAMAGPLREVVRSLDSNLPVFGVRTMADLIEQRSVTLMHVLDGIVAAVGLLGLALALVGLYAVVAYQAARRTREIGIRMAVGADRLDVVKMILKQATWMAGMGVGLGFALSFGGGRALTTQGIPAFDPVLLTLVPVALLVTTLLAAALPALRASRVDPMVALRQD